MSNQQKKMQKKKEREREVRKKVLRRRARIREEARIEAQKQKEERENEAVVNRYTKTISYEKNGRLTDEEIKERLKKNMEILQALQDEQEEFEKARAEAAKNPPDLSKIAIRPDEIKRNMGGEAAVVFTPNPEPSDVLVDQPAGNGLKPAEDS